MFARSLPNVFTIGNLFLGIVSIIFVFNNEPEIAAMLIIVAMLTDGLDGRVARALNVTSEFGKELDSLSDVISFGVAPAFIVYSVAFQDFNSPAAWIATAVFPICGALRLARFNVISGIPGYFIGLPIPAAGGVLATMALFYEELSTPILLIAELILSFLMVSNIKYPSFKKVRIPPFAMWVIPILVIIAILVAIKYPGTLSKLMFIPFVLYALLGLRRNARRVRRDRKRSESENNPKFREKF